MTRVEIGLRGVRSILNPTTTLASIDIPKALSNREMNKLMSMIQELENELNDVVHEFSSNLASSFRGSTLDSFNHLGDTVD